MNPRIKTRSAAWLAVLRWWSRLTGSTIDLGLSISSGTTLRPAEVTLTKEEWALTIPRSRKSVKDMTDKEIQADTLDRDARFELIKKLRTFGLRLTNDQLLAVIDFDGPPMYVPKQDNNVFVLSGHSLGNAPDTAGGVTSYILENLVDGKTIVLSREQLESYFQKVS